MTRRTSIRLSIVAAILVLVVALPTVRVAAQSSIPSVYVIGQVRNPGVYKFQEGLTVGQLIAMAGGVTSRGTTSGIIVIRKADNARELQKLEATVTTALQASDVVEVPNSR